MKCNALIAVFLAAFLMSCTDESSSHGMDDVFERSEEIDGFIQVMATGHNVALGTNAIDAKENDHPQMKVSFDYDFAMSRSEVTCGEFNEIMGKADLPKGMLDEVPCENKKHPVVNVTYYDAVLFANARSKQEKKDTAYLYRSVSLDASGHCNGLSGFSFRPDVDAYRLPTEAEWTFAASANWNVSKSWFAENSGYVVHEVCELSSKSTRFCDMEGNVKEFVNDWLGKFSDTSLVNFMGAPNGDGLGQRVLKGGSFKQSREGARLYRRGDDYVVTSVSMGDYVGFRLAYGSIPDPVWMNDDGSVSQSNSISLLSTNDMKSLVGSVQTKLAFRNDVTGNLEYIDYAFGSAKIYEIKDSINVFHPDISPDGKWVAFSTGMEGVQGVSNLYVRKLDPIGSQLIKLKVESAAIPRWNVTSDGDTVIVYVSDAGNNSNEAEFMNRSTWQVPFSKGRFGTPQKLFDGAYHGGVSADGKFAVTGARLLRVHNASSKNEDDIWYNEEQACNVSLAKDGSKRTLFLDFGGKTGRKFDGDSAYGVHERLLVMDSTGKLIKSIPSPKKYSFDHSEWVAPNYVLATLSNINGVHGRIVLVNMTTGAITDLVKGDELWHPALWTDTQFVNENSSLDLDSAGVYMLEDGSWASVMMRYKMELLWHFHDKVDVAIVGSSRPMYSISPSLMVDHFFAVNFAHTPNSIYASRDFLERYLFRHLKKLKYVVISLDIDFWWKIDGRAGDNFFVRDVNDIPGYVYDANHGYWKDSIPEDLFVATEKSIGSENYYLYLSDLGRYFGAACDSWGGKTPEVEIDSVYLDNEKFIENSMDALEWIIKEAGKRNVSVVGIIFPQSPAYASTGAFGRYGLRRSAAEKLIQRIDGLSETYPNFVLMDENKMGNHDYDDDMAVDYDHLCGDGVVQITTRLDSLLRGLEMEDKEK